MKLAIIGIVLGCLGILVTVLVSLKKSVSINQNQDRTKDSTQEANVNVEDKNA